MSDLIAKNISRREFVSVGVGYALAVSPVTAWAITTPTTNLEVGDISIPTGADGKETMPGYFARPTKKGNAPVVIVIHEIFGIHEYIRDVCRRLAAAGYYAVSPYLYFRQGDATKIPDIEQLRTQIINKVSQPQVMNDLDATTEWLKKQKGADVKRLAITGFCWGGNATWMYAHHNPKVKAGVAWYGRLAGDGSPSPNKFPVDVAAEIKPPVLGLYGEKDKGIPLDQVEKMRAALKKAKSKSEIIVFPGAEHGFHADYRPSYNEKSAAEGWEKMLAWFKKYV